jgi:hypothetical protein
VTLLVLVFVLSIMSTGFAAAKFSDVTNEDLSDALARLVALKIIDGYPDGTFKPNNNITRAEFAKVVVTSLGLGNAAQYAQGMTKFKDVTAAHWASGYIKVASDLGVVNGYPDGTFKPENNVTYAEAITMIVRALGYEPKAKALGGYPGGYLAIATEKEITDGVNVVGNLPATRGDVAIMLDNSLEVPMMVQTSWGQYPEYQEKEDQTLLKTKLGVKVIEGTVASFDEDEMTVAFNDVTENGTAKDDGTEYKVASGISFKNLINAAVTAWKLGDYIVYVDVDSSIKYDVVSDVVYDGSTLKEIELKYANKTYKVASGATIKIDGASGTFATDSNGDLTKDYYGKFIINDGKITQAEVLNLTDSVLVKAGQIEKVDTKNEVIEYRLGDSSGRKLRLGNYDDYKIYKDNAEVSLADLKADDVFYVKVVSNVVYVIASSKKVEGELTAVKEDTSALSKVAIDGTYYDVNSNGFLSTNNGDDYHDINAKDSNNEYVIYDAFDEEVTAYLDYKGRVAYIVADVETKSDSIYGIVRKKWQSDEDYVKIMLLDGTEKTYVIDDYGKVSDYVYLNKDYVVKFVINKDGNIEFDANFTPVAVDSVGPMTVNEKDDKLGSYYITSKTKIINVTNYLSDDEISELTWADIEEALSDGATLNAKVVDADANTNEANLVIVKDSNFKVAKDDVYTAIVLDKVRINSDNYEIKLDRGNGEEYIIFTKAEAAKATVDSIVYFQLDKDGKGVNCNAVSTVQGYVYDINGSFIKFAEVDASKSAVNITPYYRVASDAIIYDYTGDDPVIGYLSDLSDMEFSNGKVAQADKVEYYVDGNTVKAIKILKLGQTW